jgi:hypothetical protein
VRTKITTTIATHLSSVALVAPELAKSSSMGEISLAAATGLLVLGGVLTKAADPTAVPSRDVLRTTLHERVDAADLGFFGGRSSLAGDADAATARLSSSADPFAFLAANALIGAVVDISGH